MTSNIEKSQLHSAAQTKLVELALIGALPDVAIHYCQVASQEDNTCDRHRWLVSWPEGEYPVGSTIRCGRHIKTIRPETSFRYELINLATGERREL